MPENKIAIFIDVENLFKIIMQNNNSYFDPKELVEILLEKGTIEESYAFANWSFYDESVIRRMMAWFDLIFCPKIDMDSTKENPKERYKDTTDQKMDMMMRKILQTRSDINLYVVLTGDMNYSDTLRAIRNKQKKIIIPEFSNGISGINKELANETIILNGIPRKNNTENENLLEIPGEIYKFLDSNLEDLDLTKENYSKLSMESQEILSITFQHIEKCIERIQKKHNQDGAGFSYILHGIPLKLKNFNVGNLINYFISKDIMLVKKVDYENRVLTLYTINVNHPFSILMDKILSEYYSQTEKENNNH